MSDPYPSSQAGGDARRSPPPTFDHDAALRKYLELLDEAIEWMFEDRYDRRISTPVAAKLIKTSIDVAAALNGAPDRQFTYRCIVERVTPALPQAPSPENLKTIHGVAKEVEPQEVGSEGSQ